MTRGNREALTEAQGILFGLSFAAPEAISKGILAAMDVIIDVLDSEQAWDIKLSTCCQHEDIPPCEAEIYREAAGLMSLKQTISMWESLVDAEREAVATVLLSASAPLR